MSEYTELVERAELAATSAKISAAQTKSDKDTVVSLYNEIKAIIDAGGGGGSCKFYECAGVAENSWSGYEWNRKEETKTEPGTAADVTSFAISGSGVSGLDSTFTKSSDTHGDKPVYTNTSDMYCWYYSTAKLWLITATVGNVSTTYAHSDATSPENPWDATTWYGTWLNENQLTNMVVTADFPTKEVTTIVYEKSTTITEGLSWTFVKPKVGKSYTEDALVQVTLYTGSIDIEGQVLYEPLQDTIGTFTSDFTPTFQTVEGIKCCYIPYSSRLYSTEKLPVGSGAFSISFWMKPSTTPSEMWSLIIGDNSSYNGGIRFRYYENSIRFDSISSDLGSIEDVTVTDWNFFTIIYTGTSIQVYINGVSKLNTPISSFDLSSGYAIGHTDNSLDGYVASFRVFNRVLDEDDINTLYGEFSK